MQHELGQYFTTNATLKEKVAEFVLNSPTRILEPSIGRGDLVEAVQKLHPGAVFDMYEIDSHILPLSTIAAADIIYSDFIKQKVPYTYDTIIGNPPYVKTQKGNLYIDFIKKCYNLLNPGGELVFIVPSDFFKLTSAAALLTIMYANGTFTHIYHPHDEHLFENATIDVLIFRYCKSAAGSSNVPILYNNVPMYVTNTNGLITFNTTPAHTANGLFSTMFDIYVGLVSGKEEVYKTTIGNIEVLNGENKRDKYIYITSFPSQNEAINEHLLYHKPALISRAIRKFTEKNWFEWGAPRNMSAIIAHFNKPCIYINTLTRNAHVAFVGKVEYFGGNLIMLRPKDANIGDDILEKIADYLNTDAFKHNFIFSGRFKIGHRQLCNSIVPADLTTACLS